MAMIAVIVAAYLPLSAFAHIPYRFNYMGRQHGFARTGDAIEPEGAISEVDPTVPFGRLEHPIAGSLLA